MDKKPLKLLKYKVDHASEVPSRTVFQKKLGGWLVLTLSLGTMLIVLGVFYVWLQVQQIQYGYQIARLHGEYDQLLAVQRKLNLEWVRLHEPSYLEQLGRRRLGLTPPPQDQKLLMP